MFFKVVCQGGMQMGFCRGFSRGERGFWFREGKSAPHPGPLPAGEGESIVVGEVRNRLHRG
jgi:hypothetical protein